MGKRKTKTAKQRIRSAKRLSNVFSKKLGISESKDVITLNVGSAKPSFGSTSHKKQQIPAVSVSKPGGKERKRNTQPKNKVGKAVATASGMEEDQEFRRQQSSLMERELTIEWKRNSRTRPAKAKSNTLAFAPASFSLNDAAKSTDQLVQEAAAKVQSLTGIGTGSFFPSSSVTTLYPPSLPNPSAPITTVPWSSEGELTIHENPWAVLSVPEGTSHPPVPPRAPVTMQFAAASFSLGVDVDPDL